MDKSELFIILVQGRMRLSRWYSTYTQKEKDRYLREITGQVLRRREKDCNFIIWREYTVVYKRYASLFFAMIVDNKDNELITLEVIHKLVVILDQAFENVCELDLIYGFEKVYLMMNNVTNMAYLLLDEFLIGGEMQETSSKIVLNSIIEGESYDRYLLLNQALEQSL
ncbi:hypothetical protein DFA_03576 [Cavenderia fasciculata]|uniref:AP complex subunit sigma n=1 Tax=Cavenderia fasciculata TaxID=261658 RepID=F4PI44_CACFS|nr:uncharacterized protein DFA_03576 [Cavenderia fasciculata]EGG25327.1 hypothetical protein DFA_03576 [Cavenderia fasciculata]|eukprot:XP_004363178.1 hypothetical protein DFA_03576 [Cavenderia fasciculata]